MGENEDYDDIYESVLDSYESGDVEPTIDTINLDILKMYESGSPNRKSNDSNISSSSKLSTSPKRKIQSSFKSKNPGIRLRIKPVATHSRSINPHPAEMLDTEKNSFENPKTTGMSVPSGWKSPKIPPGISPRSSSQMRLRSVDSKHKQEPRDTLYSPLNPFVVSAPATVGNLTEGSIMELMPPNLSHRHLSRVVRESLITQKSSGIVDSGTQHAKSASLITSNFSSFNFNGRKINSAIEPKKGIFESNPAAGNIPNLNLYQNRSHPVSPKYIRISPSKKESDGIGTPDVIQSSSTNKPAMPIQMKEIIKDDGNIKTMEDIKPKKKRFFE
jgi:hypothetical protein